MKNSHSPQRNAPHPDLIATKKLIYKATGHMPTNVTYELESKEYGASSLRVYPSWVKITSLQAKKTQAWQCNYFCDGKRDNR